MHGAYEPRQREWTIPVNTQATTALAPFTCAFCRHRSGLIAGTDAGLYTPRDALLPFV